MWIRQVAIQNYKSFADSGWIEFGRKFNFLIGKNNSGKTALLEAFRLGGNVDMPHRDESVRKTAIVPPESRFRFKIHIEPTELFDAIQAWHNNVFVPIFIPDGLTSQRVENEFLKSTGFDLNLQFLANRPADSDYPSHGQFSARAGAVRQAVALARSLDRQQVVAEGTPNTDADNLPALFWETGLRSKIFVFSAERLKPGEVPFQSAPQILPDASNLPRALFEMEQRPAVWEEFNRLVNEVLPNVMRVVTVGVGGNIQVRLWPVDPVTDRSDLIVKLSDSGTGVGQVLAILCAVLTQSEAVICIDEPGNFLHPGAVKALMRILVRYDHQYIISTHSLDAISAVNADTVYLIEWEAGVSRAEKIITGSMDDNRRVLADLGISISDVFGVERILWVEGQTEELCLPMIVQEVFGHIPSNLAILRVRSVDELLKRKKPDDLVWDVYSRLTQAGGLVPRNVKFLFDRDGRNLERIDDLVRKSSGRIAFLPRRMFENYLLDPELILTELNAEKERRAENLLSLEEVKAWLAVRADEFIPRDAPPYDPLRAEWCVDVDGASLLASLFTDLLTAEYRKTQHSPSLTRRLLAAETDTKRELLDFVGVTSSF